MHRPAPCRHRNVVPLASSLLLALAAPVAAQDQVATGSTAAGFSPVTNWSAGDHAYRISLERSTWADPLNPLPGLQSFASATYADQWVMVAGRTNGLHGFTASGTTNFPPSRQNVDVWVVNPVTRQTWRRSLADDTPLSLDQISRLSATNTQSFQKGDAFFIAGGYGTVLTSAAYDPGTGSTAISGSTFQTHDALTAIHLPDLVSWVKRESAWNPGGLSQVTDTGGYFAVTGGEMFRTATNDTVHMVFGQNFAGPYTGASSGTYTSQVRSFTVDFVPSPSGTASLSFMAIARTPEPGDDSQFRRRDLTIVPSIGPGGTEGMIAYAGVFTGSSVATGTGTQPGGNGVWTLPVEISANGTPTMIGTTSTAGGFVQAMNHYASANLSVFSAGSGDFTTFLFGGITANGYDPASGTLIYAGFDSGDSYPWTGQISAVIRSGSGTYSQQYVGEFPLVPFTGGGLSGSTSFFGAEARFFASPGLPPTARYANGVFKLDELLALGSGTIGFIFGGIHSGTDSIASPGQSTASHQVFSVVVTPVPEPATVVLGLLGVGGLLLRACGRTAGARVAGPRTTAARRRPGAGHRWRSARSGP